MKRIGLCKLVILVLLAINAWADDSEQKEDKVASIHALHAYWVFSGLVTSESGEIYNYYFQMQRKEQHYQATAALIDSQTRRVLLFEDNKATIEDTNTHTWQVGRAFMQFNPISDSWIFGIKTKTNKGFNFKVDMLQATHAAESQNLRAGIELLINQTGRLNGHVQFGEATNEQFVTATTAWFKQIWVSKPQDALHPLTAVLCQFNNGAGFYAINLQEPDALRGALAGWRNEEGGAMPMSQFVSVKEAKEGFWHIHVPSPSLQLTVEDVLSNGATEGHQLIAGLIAGEQSGFCAISKDEIGNLQQNSPQAGLKQTA